LGFSDGGRRNPGRGRQEPALEFVAVDRILRGDHVVDEVGGRERPKLAARVEVGEERHHLPIAPHRPAIASSTLAPSPYAD
jgi:hypothetical protein